MTGATDVEARPTGRPWTRALSLMAAGGVSLLLLLYPYALHGVPNGRVHAGLPLLMLGAAGLFAHGLGFAARTGPARLVLHPALAWLLFGAGAAVIAGGG
ncbi:cyd operon YbgE family protein [Labrys wisconsinensis]|uniref:Cyd operon protein YbgE n=1 Tax=Labrys wisconsinensis TaxID=425677 RepID=A0ABU0J6F1_9HYPH|nr:cyd operon YbgE family protein [Labrys wisconsinensis]MDQ0469819.1 hypothetical protein [Labrys wisconsinensis]